MCPPCPFYTEVTFCPTNPWCVILLCQVHSLPPALTLRPAMRGFSQIHTLKPGLKVPPSAQNPSFPGWWRVEEPGEARIQKGQQG